MSSESNNNNPESVENAHDNIRSIARQPFGSNLLNKASLLHPYTWWRVSVLRNVTDFLPTMFFSFSAIVLPIVGYSLSATLITGEGTKIKSDFLPQMKSTLPLATYLCSPYVVAFAYKAVSKFLQVRNELLQTYNMRSEASERAWTNLAERIRSNRAYRTRRYDVYLPPSTSTTDIVHPLLFLPGATVEHAAYSGIAGLFSDAGYLVTVVSMEPLRVADGHLSGSSVKDLRKIQKEVEFTHRNILPSNNDKNSNWVLAGHSMGGLAATKLVVPLGISKLIMLGAAPFLSAMGDLSECTSCQVQVIQGSDDSVIQTFATPELTKEFWTRLPRGSEDTCIIILGATHSGFADYRSCWRQEVGDISNEEQQAEAVRVALNFLRNSNKKAIVFRI